MPVLSPRPGQPEALEIDQLIEAFNDRTGLLER